MKLRVWYSEGRVYDVTSVDDWKSLPAEGLLWITVFHPDSTRTFYSTGDWYYLEDNKIKYISGEWGPWKPRPNILCLDCVKRGIGVNNEEWEKVKSEALAYVN